jgi:UDP-N-acetylglucosamine--N-acetylmuramyl-(pentapeptide) pyrophosphoryl-undecaprenol N-acetylglucosamine transferase
VTVPENASAVALCYVGQSGHIEEELARRAGIPFRSIESGQIRGQAPWEIVRSLGQMERGAEQVAKVIQEFMPDVALVTGGYVAAPVAWAAWRARPRVPTLIFLPDLTPGLAIKLTSRLAASVAVSFPEVGDYFPHKAVVTGYPVRPELLAADRTSARQAFGLQAELPALLVFGGSHGSASINRALISALPELVQHCQVIHISGQADWPWVADQVALLQGLCGERYHPFSYLNEEMVQALAAADLAVARAGASVLGEFPAVGLPSILVPYPHAGKHQEANAAYLAQRGAAMIINDQELPNQLAPTILDLLRSPDRLAAMAQAAAGLARPDAAGNIVCELRRLASPTN